MRSSKENYPMSVVEDCAVASVLNWFLRLVQCLVSLAFSYSYLRFLSGELTSLMMIPPKLCPTKIIGRFMIKSVDDLACILSSLRWN